MTAYRHFAALAALCSSLAGCAPEVVFIETPPAILVEPVHVDVGGRARPMHFGDKRRLRGSLMEVSGGRIDAVHLSVYGPKGAARALAHAAHTAGVEASKIRLYPGPRLRVTATVHRALPPVCPDLKVVGPPVGDNDFEPTLGCSDLSNLAAMVNDPLDLIGNAATPPADGERAALNVSRYRAGSGTPVGGPQGSVAGQDRSAAPLTSTGVQGAPAAGR
jgi:pilus assembly protein CpaD